MHLPAALALALLLAASASIVGYTVDDSFITYRYAENLAEGHGAVFNRDGTRVEGYTSPAWMAALAAARLVTPDLEAASKALGLALNAAALLGVAWIFASVGPRTRPVAAGAALVWVAASAPLAISGVEGLETPLFTLALVAACGALLAPPGRAARAALAASLVALYLARPDGALAAAAAVGVWAMGWAPLADPSPRRRLGHVAACLAAVGAAVAAHVAWRWAYYGHLVPTTFYAKQGGSAAHLASGAERLGAFALEIWPMLVPIAAALWLARRERAFVRAVAVVAALALTRAAFVLYSGGAIMGFHRFLVPAIPLVGLVGGWSLSRALDAAERAGRLGPARARVLVAACVAGMAVWAGLRFETGADRLPGYQQTIAHSHLELGRWLRGLGPGDWLVAAGDVGAPFWVATNVDVLDLMGLNDYHIARLPGRWVPRSHSPKSDPDYVLDREPDLIVFRGDPAHDPIEGFQTIEADLIRSPRFAAAYTRVRAFGWLRVYARRDVAAALGGAATDARTAAWKGATPGE